VIWFVGPGLNSFFHRSLAPLSRTTPQFNWLEVYQSFVGNLLFTGSGATQVMIEEHNQEFPLVLNASGTGTLGTLRGPDGESVNAGTLRYPYTGWCLEALDMVRPVPLKISGERSGQLLRDRKCSSITYAGPANEFLAEYDAPPVDIPALMPVHVRKFGPMLYGSQAGQLDPTEMNTVFFENEEFYNVNVTSRSVTINLRDCQVPMYRAIARRDVDEPAIYNSPLAAGWDELGLVVRPAIVDSVLNPVIDPVNYVDNCASQLSRERRATETVSLQAIAVASGVFSGRGGRPPTKQFGTLLASDFLWGFNPIMFEQNGIRTALRWMIIDHWGVNTDF
jgi:hypothetical protein